MRILKENLADIGERIKKAIRDAGLTQKEIAKKVGLSEVSISSYTQGRIPKADVLGQIAELCGVSIEWLLTGEGEQRRAKGVARAEEKSVGASMVAEDKEDYFIAQISSEDRELLQILYHNPELKGILRRYARNKEGLNEALEDLKALIQKQAATLEEA